MRQGTHVRGAVLLLIAALLSAACGARLTDQQLTATGNPQQNGGQNTNGLAPGATVTTVAGDTSGTTLAPGQSPTNDAAAGPTPGAAPGQPGAAACSPSGGQLDVGINDSEVAIGSVATISGPVPGLFETVQRGTKAYVAYINSVGGVCGRKLKLVLSDDRLDTGTNRSETERLKDQVFAFVGGYSVVDDGGAAVLEGTNIPDIGSATGPRRAAMVNNFPTTPTDPTLTTNGATEVLTYFKNEYGVSRAAIVWPAQADARRRGQAFVRDMQAAGLNVVGTYEVAVTETNYAGVASKMKNDQVDIMMTVLDANGIARIAQAFQQVGYLPKVPFYGQQTYGRRFLQQAGTAANGTILALAHAIEADRGNNPEMDKFITWYERVNPGEELDFFAIQGWVAGSMFAKALAQAGPAPTRDAVMAQLRTFTNFEADGMIPPANPAEKKPIQCYVIVTVESQQWKRLHPDKGFACGLG